MNQLFKNFKSNFISVVRLASTINTLHSTMTRRHLIIDQYTFLRSAKTPLHLNGRLHASWYDCTGNHATRVSTMETLVNLPDGSLQGTTVTVLVWIRGLRVTVQEYVLSPECDYTKHLQRRKSSTNVRND